MNRRYYHPGQDPKPRHVEPTAARPGKRRRRVPRHQKLALMRIHGVERPSGRQWRKLRKQLAAEARARQARAGRR